MAQAEYSLLKKTLLAGSCAALLAGCTWLEEWDGKQAKAPQPQPQATLMQTADATWIKPEKNEKPVEKLVPAPDETMLETRKRLDGMEQQLADMQNDMKMIMPALTRLATLQANVDELSRVQPSSGGSPADMPATEQQIAAVDDAALTPVPLVQPVRQEESKAQAQVMAMAAAPMTPVAAPPTQIQPKPAPVAAPASYNGSGLVAQDIRFGAHPDKTRVVIDVSGDVQFTYDIDNNEKILMIDLAGTQWSGTAKGAVGDSPLVVSYDAVSNGQGGTQMAVQLSQPAKILWAQTLPAVGGKGPRIVVDIAPL